MKNSSLQYWLYAVINKHFGSAVRISRDPLHHAFEVNRHGMIVSSDSISVGTVQAKIVDVLEKCGYSLIDNSYYRKTCGNQKLTISIDSGADRAGKKALYVYPRIYRA